MKIHSTILRLLLLSTLGACHGTEVGNGRSVTPQSQSTPDTEETKETTAGGETDSSTEGDNSVEESHLFVSCGSPFAEIGAGTYTDADSGASLVVSATNISWTVLAGDTSTTIQASPTSSSPYAISGTASTLSCQDTETSGQTRTITFSDSYVVRWSVDGSGVTSSIEILDPDGMRESLYIRQ